MCSDCSFVNRNNKYASIGTYSVTFNFNDVYKCTMHILCEHELIRTANEINLVVDKANNNKNKSNLVDF